MMRPLWRLQLNIKDLKNYLELKNIILLISIGFLVLSLFQLVFVLLSDENAPIVKINSTQSMRADSWNWFGEGTIITKVETNTPDQKLPELKIDADLLGVMLSNSNSSATLKFKGRPEKVFKVGDKLSGSIELVEIQAYRIILEDSGVRKQLMMKKHDVIMQPAASESAPPSNIRQEGFAVSNLFGAVPVMVGEEQGFKVNSLSSEVKALADIRNGDVVLQVDGSLIQDLMGNPMNLMKLRSSSNLPVTILREGREEIIYVNAESLSAKMLPALGMKP
jgi:type II secretory pathway component PulC